MFKTFEEHYQSETKRRKGRSWAYPKVPEYRVNLLLPHLSTQTICYGVNYETYHSVFAWPMNPIDREQYFKPIKWNFDHVQSTQDIEALLLEAVSKA